MLLHALYIGEVAEFNVNVTISRSYLSNTLRAKGMQRNAPVRRKLAPKLEISIGEITGIINYSTEHLVIQAIR